MYKNPIEIRQDLTASLERNNDCNDNRCVFNQVAISPELSNTHITPLHFQNKYVKS
jgi:hypothetical protein